MDDIQRRLEKALKSLIELLRSTPLGNKPVEDLERLTEEIQRPCVVAVVGRVKAGKSTFVNALLGKDVAKVGVVETTATINYYRYGCPDSDFPVRCYWRNGQANREFTLESRKFLDDLYDKNDKARSIEYLEFHVQNPLLKQITFIDTPGTESAIRKDDEVTAKVLGLADAVICVLPEVALEIDQTLLQDFQQVTKGKVRSLNAIGVIAQIDHNWDIVEGRNDLAKDMADQWQDILNVVIPISAALQGALDSLQANGQAGLKRLIATLDSVSPKNREDILDSQTSFFRVVYPRCSEEKREKLSKELLGEMPWTVFTTIANIVYKTVLNRKGAVAYEEAVAAAVLELREIAGFGQLRMILVEHLVKRAQLLHCYHIVNDVQKVLEKVKFPYQDKFLRDEHNRANKRKRFLDLLQWVSHPVARELEKFVEEQLGPRPDPKKLVEEVEPEIGAIREELEVHNGDFEALQLVKEHKDLFQEERDELGQLFGLHGLKNEDRLLPSQVTAEYVKQRLKYWGKKSKIGKTDVVCKVAAQAVRRYDHIFTEMKLD
jgi:GTPase Era involved in 16S rRNA processing